MVPVALSLAQAWLCRAPKPSWEAEAAGSFLMEWNYQPQYSTGEHGHDPALPLREQGP